MKLLTDLVYKCWKNDLSIDINPHNYGYVNVWDFKNIEPKITEGSLRNWQWESPEDALNRMHREVDEYLESLYMEDDVSFEVDETEHAQARLTEYERKMKEANVKESDFL